jgi:acid phosphatase
MRIACALLCSATALFSQGTENLNAVLWVQTAAEYQAVARQTYRAAEASLDRALREPSWTAALEQTESALDYSKRPPAIILDLDETVIDNSAYQARNVATGSAFTDPGWQKWVGEKRAGLIAGAREFLTFAHGRGVNIFYVTNRVCDPTKADDPTAAVVKAHALPFRPERLQCRTDTGDKSPRRRNIAAAHRVLLMIGDDLNDFVTLPFDVKVRAEFVADLGRYWGERWFMIPNPTYGSWERSIGTDVNAKRKALRQ